MTDLVILNLLIEPTAKTLVVILVERFASIFTVTDFLQWFLAIFLTLQFPNLKVWEN